MNNALEMVGSADVGALRVIVAMVPGELRSAAFRRWFELGMSERELRRVTGLYPELQGDVDEMLLRESPTTAEGEV